MTQFVAVASFHLNFYPGTLTPTPAEFRQELHSYPKPTRSEAEEIIRKWRSAVDRGCDWEFRIEERPGT